MRTSILLVAAASLLFAAVPAQGQDVGINNPNTSTPTTLYFHVINVQDMPINTQLPSPDYSDEGRFGTTTNTITCVDAATGGVGEGSTSAMYHTFYGYSSPSYVEYDYMENGQPRTHPERGISYDTELDQSTPFTLYWYLATFNGAAGPLDGVPTPLVNVVVQASMRSGDAISVDDKGYDGGDVIAEGRTNPAIASSAGVKDAQGGDHTQVKYIGPVDGKHLYEFAVPMEVKLDKIPRSTGFNVRIDTYMDAEQACQDQENKNYLMANSVAVYTSPQYRPRMQMAVMNPIRLEYLHPQFVGDDLVVHTSMNSAWGNYDVDETTADGIKVGITGPSPATSLAKAALVQRFHEHYHHQEAVDVTYVWPYKADRATNGLYTVEVSFKNDQGTATASGTAQFEIGKGTVIGCGGVQEASQRLNDDCAATIQKDGQAKSEESPGLPVLGLLALLGALAVALRRRSA